MRAILFPTDVRVALCQFFRPLLLYPHAFAMHCRQQFRYLLVMIPYTCFSAPLNVLIALLRPSGTINKTTPFSGPM